MMSEVALEREAIRLFLRYQLEIVEDLRLCPWAESARQQGRTRPKVVPIDATDPRPALDAIFELAEDPTIEIGFLLFPRLRIGRLPFERYVAELGRQDQARWGSGAPFALAAFHPDAELDLSDAERLVPFVRRTPDPTVQLVRLESLERVRKGFNEGTQLVDIEMLATKGLSAEDTLPLRSRIARANLRTVRRIGASEVERRLADIRRDRDTTYLRVAGIQPPCPSS